MLLAQSLKDLCQSKPLDLVTVTEITKKAGLTRQAFYHYFIDKYELLIQIFGSVVLAGFGAYIYRQNPAKNLNLKKPKAANHIQDLISAFFLTLSNPLILFLFIGLFARFNFFTPESQLHDYVIGYASIIGGAFLWWLTITYFINKVRSKFNLRSLWIINRCIGSIIILMSAYGFISGVYNYFN